jgi:hypothetical protein
MHPHEYTKMCAAEMPANDQLAEVSVGSVAPGKAPESPKGPPSTVDDDTLLTSAPVRARVGNVSTMCVWRWMRDPRVMFPRQVKINLRNYWRLGDLRRWQAERAAASGDAEVSR